VHLAQRRRREHGLGIALVALDFVLEAELFEQPEDPLRAGIVQVVHDDHRLALLHLTFVRDIQPCP
jgi:hypothetical protein